MPNTLIWDEIPVVDNFDQASDIHNEVMEAWFNIKRQYNK